MHDDIDKLGPFPIIQLVAAIVILLGLALAIFRGSRDRRAEGAAAPLGADQRLYLDGPIVSIMTVLREQRELMHQIELNTKPLGEEARLHTRQLDGITDLCVEIAKADRTRHRRS